MTARQRTARLVALVKAHGIPWPLTADQTEIKRTHAGPHQRSAGAWSWQLYRTRDAWEAGHTQFPSVGSQWTVREILKRGIDGTEVYVNPYGSYELIPKAEKTPQPIDNK